LAAAIQWHRGIAVAYNALGNAFLGAGKADSALLHYQLSVTTSESQGLFDVELLDYGGMAKAAAVTGEKAAALQWLQLGFTLIKNRPAVNNLFAGQFLDDAILIYKQYEQKDLLTVALEKKSALLQQQIKNNNQQMNVILNAGLQNETRLLNLEVQQAKQQNEIINTRMYLLVSFIALLLAAFFLYRYRIRQKLQLMQLQHKISQDLHDDVGSSLSSMQVYSTVAEQLIDSQPAKAKDILKKISAEATSVMENIGDIVWAMKPGNGQSIQLDTRIKNFASDVLSAASINYVINVEEGIEPVIKNFTAKKNMLLIIKAAIDNAVKYSRASYVAVSVKKIDDHICVQVSDNGKGFDKTAGVIDGNGLTNMRFRTEELRGVFEITSSPGKGTTISALLPITIISDTV
jgi:signal transduction histidine kinase